MGKDYRCVLPVKCTLRGEGIAKSVDFWTGSDNVKSGKGVSVVLTLPLERRVREVSLALMAGDSGDVHV